MKLLKTILGLIIVAFVGLVMLRSMAYGPLKFDTDKIYTASIEDENHILVFTDDYKMLLYRYGEEEEQNPYNKNQSMKYYYGVETVYKYNAAYYNKILGPLHSAPDIARQSLISSFLTQYKLYDESKEQRARMNLTVEDSRELFVENYKAPTGKFNNLEVRITQDRLSIDAVEYRVAKGDDLLIAQTVIDDFKELSK